MLNSNNLGHEYFEELCCLASLGQISADEHILLKNHLSTCFSCRASLGDFNEILHEHLPLVASQEELLAQMDRVNLPLDDLKQRFLQRAAAEGIVLSDKIKRGTDSSLERIFRFIPPFTWTWKAQLAAACTLLIIGLLTLVMGYRIRNLREENSIAHEEISKLKRAMAGAEQQPPNILPQSSDTTRFSGLSEQKVEPQSKSQTEWEISELRRELRKSKAEHESLLSKSRTLEEQLQHASNEVTALRSQILSLKDQATDGQRLKETEIALRQVSLELEKLQREKNETASIIATQQSQIRELSNRLTIQTDNLERERELFATGREIRNLMGARSLHIIDVADVDSKGTQRPFGRVFYTEGKSLLFYAYDLEKRRKSLEKFSFQAWGQTGTKPGAAQSLGLFQADDQTQSRWVLKCDDPSLLAQIDSVFVTIEPRGGSSRPQGQQLMYAFLRANPNHP